MTSDPRAPRSTAARTSSGSGAAALATATVVGAAAAVLALHALRRDLEPASHRLSEYAIGPWGWLMTSAFAALAVALWLLRRALPLAAPLRPVRALLTVATIGFALSAVFPTDPTRPDAVRETVHTVASTGALVALTAAALWTVTRGAGAIGWRRAHGPAGVATAVAALGVLIGPLVHDSPWTGAVQRVVGLALTAWLLLLCRAITPRATSGHRSGR
jgi:Protein of unknown function (DUF998)